MGDGEAPIVGGGQPEVRATTSTLGDVPVVTEWAPAREPAAESSIWASAFISRCRAYDSHTSVNGLSSYTRLCKQLH